MYFFYRNDIKMTSGKVIAQLCHAAMLPLLSVAKKVEGGICIDSNYLAEYKKNIMEGEVEIIGLSSDEFFLNSGRANNCHLIFDTGKTVFNGVFTATAMVLIEREDLKARVIDYEKIEYSETNFRQVFIINYSKKRDIISISRDSIKACIKDIASGGRTVPDGLLFDVNSAFYSWFLGGFPKIALVSKNIDEKIKKIKAMNILSTSIESKDMGDSVIVLSPQERFLVDQITSDLRLY